MLFWSMNSSKTDRINQLFQLLEQSPDDSFILFAIANEYKGLNDFENASKWFLKLKVKDPGYTGLYFHYGKTLEALHKNIEAKNIYLEGIEMCTVKKDVKNLSELEFLLEDLSDRLESF